MEEGWRVKGERNEDDWKGGGLKKRGMRMVGGRVEG